jgi:hypothetical protein
MNACPICLFVNMPDAATCKRCGRFHFVKEPAAVVANGSAHNAHSAPEDSQSTKLSGVISAFRTERYVTPTSGHSTHSLSGHQTKATSSSSGSGLSSRSTRLLIKPRLEVVRGEKLQVYFLILEGRNVLGRTVNTPVDIDLTGQEPIERVWSSRQHACIVFDGRTVILEDLNSLNGTFVNRQRLFPGQQRVLQANDVIQIGTVQLRLLVDVERIDVEVV